MEIAVERGNIMACPPNASLPCSSFQTNSKSSSATGTCSRSTRTRSRLAAAEACRSVERALQGSRALVQKCRRRLAERDCVGAARSARTRARARRGSGTPRGTDDRSTRDAAARAPRPRRRALRLLNSSPVDRSDGSPARLRACHERRRCTRRRAPDQRSIRERRDCRS
jgi:hypothetical protein